MRADFSKFVGREPTFHKLAELAPPKDWKQLEDADPAVTSHIRRELAILEAKRYELERSMAVPGELL